MDRVLKRIATRHRLSGGRCLALLAIVVAGSWIPSVAGEVQPADPGVAEVSVTESSGTLDAKRQAISNRLQDLGASERDAEAAATQLSQADVETLYANPKMVQAAGDVDEGTAAIIVLGVVIVVLLIIIAT